MSPIGELGEGEGGRRFTEVGEEAAGNRTYWLVMSKTRDEFNKKRINCT